MKAVVKLAIVLRSTRPAFYGSVELALEAVCDWTEPEELARCVTDVQFMEMADVVNIRAGSGRAKEPRIRLNMEETLMDPTILQYKEEEAKGWFMRRKAELTERNPACEFVLAENGLTLYWRCIDGFDYGLYSYTLDGQIALCWNGDVSLIWRRWRADADTATQVSVAPSAPSVPAQPDAFADRLEPSCSV